MTQLELIVREGYVLPDACGQPSQSLRPIGKRSVFAYWLPVGTGLRRTGSGARLTSISPAW
jgi:hypothetical protein